MSTAIGVIAGAEETPTVAVVGGGAISNPVFHERASAPMFDEDRSEEYVERSATLTYSIDGPELTPQVSVVTVAGERWRVVAANTIANHRQYALARRDERKTTPNRGASS